MTPPKQIPESKIAINPVVINDSFRSLQDNKPKHPLKDMRIMYPHEWMLSELWQMREFFGWMVLFAIACYCSYHIALTNLGVESL
jgi:hypothetical protein